MNKNGIMARMLSPLHDLMSQAVDDAVFPGAVLLVDVGGRLIVCEAFGSSTRIPAREAMTVETVFDLASLTKPLVTAGLTLGLAAEGRLALDEPVARHISTWDVGAASRVTIRHLLTHSSGLPAWRPFYRRVPAADVATLEGKRRIIELAASEALEAEPGVGGRYSDLGFILLGSIIERLMGRPLDRLFTECLARPLSLSSTAYAPIGDGAARAWLDGRRVAATETCPWRGRTLRGEVHDENSYAMGGVSGHAGLFGTAEDVRRLTREWMVAARGGSTLWPAEPAATFLTRQREIGSGGWALGWTVPTPPSTSGRHFSPRSFGHLGFTGTSVWADPEQDLLVILLSNRVHPTRANQAIARFRPRLHDAVYESVIGGPSK